MNDSEIRALIFPKNNIASMLLWSAFSSGVGLLTSALGTTVLKDYGLALFCGVPLAMGIVAPLFHGLGAPRKFRSLLAVNVLAQCGLFFMMVGLGVEGLGCLIMCAPLWFVFALVGTAIIYPIHEAIWDKRLSPRGFPVMGLVLVMLVPTWMGAEHVGPQTPEVWAVTTSVEIDAPRDVVWRKVVAFPELPPPTEWVFDLGVAYPEHAVIVGHGVGATRYCVFSTGAFVEPIRVWEEGKLLAFDVVQSPPSMQERNPFWDIHPAHLEGYMVSRHGQFELVDLGHGRTRLVGTTWYQNKMFPASYWRLWSDMIVHRIHLRVLNHIKAISETGGQYEHA